MENNLEQSMNLSANSGAKFQIYYSANGLIVQKLIPSCSQRVLKSIRKQSDFKGFENLRAAQIFSIDERNGQTLVEMELLRGFPAEELYLNGDESIFEFIADVLSSYFEKLNKKSTDALLPADSILKKLDEIHQACRAYQNTRINKLVKHLTDKIKVRLEGPILYPVSDCHGDFTLSNMVFDYPSRMISLIDFLDVFLNSYLLDYVKIEQDTVYAWSARNQDKTQQLSYQIAMLAISKKIRFNPDKKYDPALNILRDLNYLRIVPYVDDKITEIWLEDVLIERLEK